MEQATGTPINIAYRRLGVGDALIVLAAIAVALGVLWDTPGLYQHLLTAMFIPENWPRDSTLANWLRLIQGFSALIAMVLCVANATLLTLALRFPRPPLWRLARQPGFMASATVMMLLIPGTILVVKSVTIARIAFSAYSGYGVLFTDPRFLLTYLLSLMPIPTALAILASWFTLILNRRWSPQPTWLDRAGRTVAWAWLILAIL